MNRRIGLAPAAFALLAACGGGGDGEEESPIDAIDAPAPATVPPTALPEKPEAGDDALPPVVLVAPAIQVPDAVPRPAEYTLLSEVPGPAALLTMVEVREDVRQMAARFNREMAQSPLLHEPLRPHEDEEGRYVATGSMETPEGRVRIGVREYASGERPPSGGTGEVTYGVPTG